VPIYNPETDCKQQSGVISKDMDIQTLEYSDIKLIADLQPAGWDIIPSFKLYTLADFCFPIKITIHKKIVGIGSAIIHKDSAWLAHIVVHPDHRNQGIGTLVTKSLIDLILSKSCDTIYLIATELGEPIYKKLGFEPETAYLLFNDIKTTAAFTNSKNIVPFTPKFKEEILTIDRQVSGENRIVLLEQYLSDGFVYVQNNRVTGFYLPTCKEGLIIATSHTAGQELMKLRLTTKENASFPIENASAIEFMSQNNFKASRTVKRMRLGKPRNWQPSNIYNRIGGNLG